MAAQTITEEKRKFLELLSEKYPTIQSTCTEIINLNAILELPKGTEHFVSDIHGEAEAFTHILNNASGVIREKVDALFEKSLDRKTRTALCTLIYYPELKLKELVKGRSEEELDEWYMITLYRLIQICRYFAGKYTRSKVRKALPKDFEYILDELLNADDENENKQEYYENIVRTIIRIGRADAFISALSDVIKRLAVDHLHIVGDIFDRGPHPDVILDKLIQHHAVDVQWGNHDVLWMGAAAGSGASIACLINISTRYDNIDLLEDVYGINLRPLAMFAQQVYPNLNMVDAIHRAIAIIQFKLEAEIIKRHPEYQMDDRLLLDKIDYEKGTVEIGDKTYTLNTTDFPTVDPTEPYALTEQEREVVSQLIHSFRHCEKLQRHVRFLYSQGSLYKVFNGNLLFHGCIPMNADGSFCTYPTVKQGNLSGKAYMDWADQMVRKAYYADRKNRRKREYLDYIWYLWCGPVSPLFGRDRMTTFERMFIDDKSTWTETKNAYYNLVEDEEVCLKILAEFGLDNPQSHIINGHVPVIVKEGEVPVHGGGRLIIIDGGFSRAYQDKTGIAGYTLFFSSYGLRLVSHQPFAGLHDAVRNNEDIVSTYVVFDTADRRLRVRDTDNGIGLQRNIDDLTALLDAYQKGTIKEKRSRDGLDRER